MKVSGGRARIEMGDKAIATVEPGTVMRVTDVKDNLIRVELTGWIHTKRLRTAAASGQEEIAAGDRVITTSAAPVKVGKKVLATVRPGTESAANKIQGSWVKVTIGGWTGERRLFAVAASDAGVTQVDWTREAIGELLARWKLEEAARRLANVKGKDEATVKWAAEEGRAVEALIGLRRRMINLIKTSEPPIQKSELLIRGFNGDLVDADQNGITVAIKGTRKSERLAWRKLSSHSVHRLTARVAKRGSAGDQCGVALFLRLIGEKHEQSASGAQDAASPPSSPIDDGRQPRPQETISAVQLSKCTPLCGIRLTMRAADRKAREKKAIVVLKRLDHFQEMPTEHQTAWLEKLRDALPSPVVAGNDLTYFLQKMGILFGDDGSVKQDLSKHLLRRWKTIPKDELDAWERAFEKMGGRDIVGQEQSADELAYTLRLRGAGDMLRPEMELTLLAADRLYVNERYTHERARKYRQRLETLSRREVKLWKDRLPAYSGAGIDAALSISLVDSFFRHGRLDREAFDAAMARLRAPATEAAGLDAGDTAFAFEITDIVRAQADTVQLTVSMRRVGKPPAADGYVLVYAIDWRPKSMGEALKELLRHLDHKGVELCTRDTGHVLSFESGAVSGICGAGGSVPAKVTVVAKGTEVRTKGPVFAKAQVFCFSSGKWQPACAEFEKTVK